MSQILVVDDEPDLCELVEVTLKRKKYSVSAACSGEKALEMLEDETPDLILLDVGLPGLNGWEVLKEMAGRSTIEKVPVAMFTGEKLTLTEILRKDIENLVGYIEKPFNSSDLLSTVEKILERTRRIYRIKEEIANCPNGGEDLSRAFLAWNRTQMIHERLLEKLKELRWEYVDDDKLARIDDLIEGEKQTIQESKLKKTEILRLAGLEDLVCPKVS